MLLCVGLAINVNDGLLDSNQLAINVVNDDLLDSNQLVCIIKHRGTKRRTIGH